MIDLSSTFTIFNIVYEQADKWINNEKNIKTSLIGNLMKSIERKSKLRDAQIEAIKIYLWLKEEGKNTKLSDLIKSGKIFDDASTLYYLSDHNFINQPVKRFINRYLQDASVSNRENYLGINLEDSIYDKFVDDLFEEFNYSNYLFSLPMGAGKTFLIASFIYIDLYMYLKTNDDKYGRNFIILAPSARKTAILPALKTIKKFNPAWILPEQEAKQLKKAVKIEVLDEISGADKLQNQNPNLTKIKRTISGHSLGNVFILNAEKVITDSSITNEQLEILPLSQRTKISRANAIKNELAKLDGIQIFLDEAHHSYSSDSETKKLRKQLDVINANKNVICCIGMSGTPYVDRKIKFNNRLLKVKDIQDIVYYYPLKLAIGKFLKIPDIRKDSRDENALITSALNEFFNSFDKKYKNGTLSKIAFYCPNIDTLNKKILPVILKWYEENNRDKNEILRYYTDRSIEFPLPKENKIHFLNLDNPTSKHRVVLLVGIGTEGWDCRSLTSVVLPRQSSARNFVLQTTCRCLREVDNAAKEKALIYLDDTNYDILENELNINYHLSISDINGKEDESKDYPVLKIKNDVGKITYKEVHSEYIEIINSKEINYEKLLENYDIENFKKKYPFINQIGYTTINSQSLNDNLHFKNQTNNEIVKYSFIDFIYDLEKSSYGLISCAELFKFKDELNKIYLQIIKPENMSWIVNHKNISIIDLCNDIISIFADTVECRKEEISNEVSINLLKWNEYEDNIINISKNKKDLVFPNNSYDDIETGIDCYESNLKELKRRYDDKMKYANKEKSFSYLPYRMDSMYEYNFLLNALKNMDNLNVELYYNGYKNENLESFKIITPYGKYTPDFLLIKRGENNDIIKIMIIETKGHPYETQDKEYYVKNIFIPNNPNYTYIRIEDTQNDINEYNKMIKCIVDFAND